MLDQSASNEVLKRRHRSRLPPVYDARNLFNTPGAGTSNPPGVNRAEAPGAGVPVQPRLVDPPRQNNIVTPHVPTPPGHYSNPMDNLVAAAARLEAIPIEGDSPQAVETRRVKASEDSFGPTGSILVQPRPDPLDTAGSSICLL